jgi:ligand-binding SRPBCC domain-containing protein
MPSIKFKTTVAQPPAKVWEGFNEALFKALNPPFPPVRLKQFGMAAGERVELELRFPGFPQRWVSYLPESGPLPEGGYRFVDIGEELPFFLREWRHRHLLEPAPRGGTWIIDDVFYRTPNALLDTLLYPALWLQFAYRRPIYRKFFRASVPAAG